MMESAFFYGRENSLQKLYNAYDNPEIRKTSNEIFKLDDGYNIINIVTMLEHIETDITMKEAAKVGEKFKEIAYFQGLPLMRIVSGSL